jgi:hypothetical protein
MVHAHLELARHPRHQAQALAPLQAVLELLEERVCEAATFRYTLSILLRLLPIRCTQNGSDLLGWLVGSCTNLGKRSSFW